MAHNDVQDPQHRWYIFFFSVYTKSLLSNLTKVDDLFAFVIKMPLLHRIACFRDDIIFVIFLYQYWHYDVDHKRKNEFGQGGDKEESEEALKTKKVQ